MITLVLEASTYEGSVALLDGPLLLGAREVAMRGRDHETLMPAVANLLVDCAIEVRGITRVVCGAGPGSFTSLRIAGAIAKGVAQAVGATLVPVSSLALLVGSLESPKAGRYLAALDAMRGEHYVQLFAVLAGGEISEAGPMSLSSSAAVDALAEEWGAVAVGPARAGHRATPSARAAARITHMIDSASPADLAGWEPGYGRLAEAQVKWEAVHGRPLMAG